MAAVGTAIDPTRWEKDDATPCCRRCRAEFHVILKRKHHCRRCGRLFCADCSDKTLLLATAGGESHASAVRSCRGCYELMVGRSAAVVGEALHAATTLPNGAPWRMAWMFADASLIPETGVGAIDRQFKWVAAQNPGRWEGGRYRDGSSPAEVVGMLRRLSAARYLRIRLSYT